MFAAIWYIIITILGMAFAIVCFMAAQKLVVAGGRLLGFAAFKAKEEIDKEIKKRRSNP